MYVVVRPHVRVETLKGFQIRLPRPEHAEAELGREELFEMDLRDVVIAGSDGRESPHQQDVRARRLHEGVE